MDETVPTAEVPKSVRRRFPDERPGTTRKLVIENDHTFYITINIFPDGTPGEIFIVTAKEGSTLSGWADALAKSISQNLQYGVPVEAIVRMHKGVSFEPSGRTNDPKDPIVRSVPDYIAKLFERMFLNGGGP